MAEDDKTNGVEATTNKVEEPDTKLYQDYTNHFTHDGLFRDRIELTNWIQKVGKDLGFVLVTFRSDKGGYGRRKNGRVEFACENSGKFRKRCKNGEKYITGSRKTECPFRLYGRGLPCGGWKLIVKCGRHNHDSYESMDGHPFPGRPTEEERANIINMTKCGVMPQKIQTILKRNNPDNCTSRRQINNIRANFRKTMMGGRTEMQYLLKRLCDQGYEVDYCKDEETNIIKAIFWAHPDGITLLNLFSIVLVMDTTYKTNQYDCPLLEFVGQTSTHVTFNAAFCFMEGEKESNFTWALKKLRALILRDDALPQVIVTDKDMAMVNAVEAVFPTSTHLLCEVHISKNVESKVKKTFPNTQVEKVKKIMDEWKSLVKSHDEVDYESRLQSFKSCCGEDVFDYVNRVYLEKYKHKFVHAWINKVMHLGNTTSNRVESAHARLKRELLVSSGDLNKCFDAMENMLSLQHSDIKASFQQSLSRVDHRVNNNTFKEIRFFVSRSALDLIWPIVEILRKNGGVSSGCSHTLRKTHGLPCECEVAKYIRTNVPIPLSTIHIHWRRLSFSCKVQGPFPEVIYDADPYCEEIKRQAASIVDPIARKRYFERLHEFVHREATSMVPPKEKFKTKGPMKGFRKFVKEEKSTKREPSEWEHVDREWQAEMEQDDILWEGQWFHCRQSKGPSTQASQATGSTKRKHSQQKPPTLLDNFPKELHPYIDKVVDVKSDGHCGFRSLSLYKFGSEENYMLIRQELSTELRDKKAFYETIMGETFYDKTKKALCAPRDPVGREKWFDLPDMGHLVANKFNVVFVSLYTKCYECCTYLPHSSTTSPTDRKVWVLGNISNSHWVQVQWKKGAPLPKLIPGWSKNASGNAQGWKDFFVKRFNNFKSFLPNPTPSTDEETVDLSNS